jgi:hypothetical protein
MSTNKTTTTTNAYNPQGMANYNAYQGTLPSILQGYAQNPFGNPFYQLNLGNNMAAANTTNMNNFQNAMSNFNMAGMGGAPSGARTQLMNQLTRGASGINANAFFNAASNAFQNQWNAMGMMNSFQPLQTGGTQVQKTSGLGTWLPQLAGAALGGAMDFATGGMSSLLGGLGGGLNNALLSQGTPSQIASAATLPMGPGGGFNTNPNIGSLGNPFNMQLPMSTPALGSGTGYIS